MASFHCSVKVGGLGKGAAHAAYICREGKYERLLHSDKAEKLEHFDSINMPEWAKERPLEFWEQADLRERKNGSVYREFELALPNELTSEQAAQLVRDFVRNEIGDKHACTWAIHNGRSAIDGTVNNRNAHIMFSERLRDGIERGPDTYFKREAAAYRHRVSKELIQPDAAAKAKGGHGKLDTYNGTRAERRETLVALRARFADLTNAHLAQHGHTDRVTHLSLKDQGVDRTPEQHLGPKQSRNAALVAPLKAHRTASVEAEQAQALAAEIVKTHQQEKANEHTRQQRTRSKQRQQPTRYAEVQHMRGIDDVSHVADRPEVLLQPNEPDHMEQPEARQDHRLLHELDAERAARAVAQAAEQAKQQAAQAAQAAERQQQAQAQEAAQRAAEAERQRQATNKALEDGIRRAREEAARKTTAAQELGKRDERRQKWQTKHIQRPGVAVSPGALPKHGKPAIVKWEYTTGLAKGKPAVIDYGDRIKPAGKTVSDTKIAALLEVAKTKGWPALAITGPQDFRMRVAEAAQARGMPLADLDLVVALRAKADEQKQIQAQMKEREAPAPTPSRTPLSDQAREARAQVAAIREKRFKAQMEERKAVPTPSPSKPLIPPQATIPTIVGDQPPPVVKPITELMQAETDLNSKIRKLGEEERAAAPVDKGNHAWQLKRWTDEAWAKAGATVDIQLRAAHPKAGIPANWENNLDSARGIQQMHLQEKRPRFMNGDYDARTEHNSAAVASWEKLVNERVEKARAVAQAIYDQKIDAHRKSEADKAQNLISISKERGALIEQRNALSKELETRRPEVQAVYEQQRQAIKQKSRSHGIPNTPSKGRGGRCD